MNLTEEGGEEFVEGDAGDGGGFVAHGVGEDDFVVVEEGATTVDDVGDVTLAFDAFGREERFAKSANDLGGIFEVEQDGTDAVFAHGADAMGNDEPAGWGLDGRTTVTDFDGFPDFGGTNEKLRIVPIVEVVGEHDEEVLIVLSGQHRIVAVDASWEQCHALVLNSSTVEGDDAEVQEVFGLNELGQDGATVVSGVGRVIHDGPVIFDELHKTGVFDAVAFIGRDGKDDAFTDAKFGREAQFVVGIGEPLNALKRAFEFVIRGLVFVTNGAHALVQIITGEVVRERGHDGLGEGVVESHFAELMNEAGLAVAGVDDHFGNGDKTRGAVEMDVAIRRNESRAEFDGGDVAFAGGAQAHDES